MSALAVREIVLYKHGVGFFVRQGTVTGDQIDLTFRRDEINDVLKSLAVFDQAGGQIQGIHYHTPIDVTERLASSSINLSQNKSLYDLITDLRGRDCTLSYEVIQGTLETLTGRIIGIDDLDQPTQAELPNINVSLLTTTGVRIIPYHALRGLQIQDEQSAHDLRYFLDTSMTEDERRVITVRLNSGEHDLVVFYVAPSPTWRVSYRLIAETDAQDNSTGTALLQGWGLFDNRLEEDLTDVKVTLVAGQPISFIYDLYASRIPQRPVIEDETRIAPAPVEFDADFREPLMKSRGIKAAAPKVHQYQSDSLSDRLMVSGGIQELAESTPVQAETKATGETFQYEVTSPVSIKRGESALVPIIGKSIAYERELLYNRDKMANHPVVAMRFENKTQLTLERGPVTVIEDGHYKGEAIIPFTKEDVSVYVPFAVELGIKITEKEQSDTIVSGLQIKNHALFEQSYYQQTVTYNLKNNTGTSQTVTIEAHKRPAFELYETQAPTIETSEVRRWQITVPAHDHQQFVRTERRQQWNRREVRTLQFHHLAHYLEKNWLDQTSYDQLHGILQAITELEITTQSIQKLETHRDQIYGQQEQLRANLGALQASGKEATLRDRLLKQLEQTQDRLDTIEAQLHNLRAQIDPLKQTIDQRLNALS